MPEDLILKQGDEPEVLYFLSKGEVEVLVKDEKQEEMHVKILLPGALFGEVALIANCKRTATIKSLNYCTCASLTATYFKEMCRLYPEAFSKLKEKMRQYNDKWKEFLIKLVQGVSYFKGLTRIAEEELIYSMK